MDMTAINSETSPHNEVTPTGVPIVDASPAKPGWLRPALLDRAEQAVIAVLWLWLLARVWQAFLQNHNAFALLLPLGEAPVLLFTLIRRPTDAISMRWGDWLLAITATAAPLCVVPVAVGFPRIGPVTTALWGVGCCVQIVAKLSLRRSFGIAPANRGIKVDGLYRLVRHPMYGGYLLMHISFLALMPSTINALIYGIGWAAQIRRLLAEEALLRQDPAYAAYMARVRWRLLPGVF